MDEADFYDNLLTRSTLSSEDQEEDPTITAMGEEAEKLGKKSE